MPHMEKEKLREREGREPLSLYVACWDRADSNEWKKRSVLFTILVQCLWLYDPCMLYFSMREPKIIIIRLCVSANKNWGGGEGGGVVVACVTMQPVSSCLIA
jgi:hypothetical protein